MTALASLVDRIAALDPGDQALVESFLDQLEAVRTRPEPPADPLDRIRQRIEATCSRSET